MCNHENWARVTLTGNEVTAIEAVDLDRGTLMSSQYITSDCIDLAAQLSGIPTRDLLTGKVNPVSVLLDRLR
jgi:hypothetical protein